MAVHVRVCSMMTTLCHEITDQSLTTNNSNYRAHVICLPSTPTPTHACTHARTHMQRLTSVVTMSCHTPPCSCRYSMQLHREHHSYTSLVLVENILTSLFLYFLCWLHIIKVKSIPASYMQTHEPHACKQAFAESVRAFKHTY